jgi:hypothetical protein
MPVEVGERSEGKPLNIHLTGKRANENYEAFMPAADRRQRDLPDAAVQEQARRAQAIYQQARPGHAGDSRLEMERMTQRWRCD